MKRSSDPTHPIQMKGALTGVTRLSSKAKFAILLLGLMVLGFIVFSMVHMDQNAHSIHLNKTSVTAWEKHAERRTVRPAKPTFEKMFEHAPSSARPLARAALPPMALSNGAGQKRENAAPLPADNTFEQTLSEHHHAHQEKVQRQRRAIRSALEMHGGGARMSAPSANYPRASSEIDRLGRVQSDRITSALTAAAQATRMAQNSRRQLEDNPILNVDANQQGQKEQFLNLNHRMPKTYLNTNKQRPLSPFEIKAGWVIPAALECGLNSDLPGQTCARVTENVYDTATGQIVLIPQGTKVIGTYDSRIAYGQQRILVVWNRLIFPDASSISLNGMPGADKAGHAGFDADVDRHTLSVFGNALLMAIFSAGIEHTQQRNTLTDRALNNDLQSVSQSLGQQLGHTGAALIQRGMNVQPTLTRPPGYTFNIIATHDIVFPGAYRSQIMQPR